jgi:formate hydrogenlyase subunit 6/NADH:ubiquinone oxidoreductase subunit I
MSFSYYLDEITRSANTIFEGLAVTFSHLFREPVTIQYPDRTTRPVREMLPERYRGFLEVQLDICAACKRCERACPVECIVVETQKNPETKKLMVVRFDLDVSKCMFCGLCVEACEDGATGAIRHTREFEGSVGNLDALVFRFVPEGKEFPMYRAPKDKAEIPIGEIGPSAREARERALRDNPALFDRLRREAKADLADKSDGTSVDKSSEKKAS